jgi:hypothetical protein
MQNASDEMVIPGRDDGLWWEQGRWDELAYTSGLIRQ